MAHLSRAFLDLKQYEAAAEQARETIRIGSVYLDERLILASALGHLGRAEEARAVLNEAEEHEGLGSRSALHHGYPGNAEAEDGESANDYYQPQNGCHQSCHRDLHRCSPVSSRVGDNVISRASSTISKRSLLASIISLLSNK